MISSAVATHALLNTGEWRHLVILLVRTWCTYWYCPTSWC